MGRCLAIFLMLALLQLGFNGQNNSHAGPTYSKPNFKPNRSVIVQLFEWKFADVARECEEFLGPKGYAGVELSPVTEHLVYVSDSLHYPWWERYYPVSYEVASRSGTQEDFLAMSKICNAAGIRIYVGVVLNHMAGLPSKSKGTVQRKEDGLLRGYAGARVNLSALEYPAVPYRSQDFHKPCQIENFMDGHEVRNCQLDGRPDLDHSRSAVRQKLVELLDKLINLGAAGFCVHAAQYMWPIDLKKIFSAVKNLNSDDFDFPPETPPFFYQDVLDLGTEAISKTEYSGYGVVTEYLYAAQTARVFSGQTPLSALVNWGPAMGFLPHHEALVFIDTPETQRKILKQFTEHHHQVLTYRWRTRYIMANAFMLAHPYGGVKRIMSSYYFDVDTIDAGPPTLMTPVENDNRGNDGGGDGKDESIINTRAPHFDETGQCSFDSGWVCEHRWPPIANLIEFVNTLDELNDGVINFQTDGPQHISFCRGNKAFFAFNNDERLDYEREVFTCLDEGIYCDVITGGRTADSFDCQGKRIVVDIRGNANLSLLAIRQMQMEITEEEIAKVESVELDFGVIAIFVGSKLMEDEAAGGKEEVVEDDVKKEVEFITTEVTPEEESVEEMTEKAPEEQGDNNYKGDEEEGKEVRDEEEEGKRDNDVEDVDAKEAPIVSDVGNSAIADVENLTELEALSVGEAVELKEQDDDLIESSAEIGLDDITKDINSEALKVSSIK